MIEKICYTISSQIKEYRMNIFGIIEISWAKDKQEKFDRLCEELNEHGYRAVKITEDKSKKRESAKLATQSRSDKARAKMDEAMESLRFQDKPITAYRLAKESGVSQTTAKKYLEEFGIETKKKSSSEPI